MKLKINFKILFLVLALTELWEIIHTINSAFQPSAIIVWINSVEYKIVLLMRVLLFLTFGILFLKAKEVVISNFVLPSILTKLTWFFMWFIVQIKWRFFIDFIDDFPIITIPINLLCLVPLFYTRKSSKVTEQISKEGTLETTRKTYENMLSTLLAATIFIFCKELIFYIAPTVSNPKPYFTMDFVLVERKLVIIISLILFFGYEMLKRQKISRLLSLNQVVFGYTLVLFALYFFFYHVVEFITYRRISFSLFQYVSLTFIIGIFVWFYFRKGKQLITQDVCIVELAFSAFFYCISIGLILVGLTYLFQVINGSFYNSVLYISLQLFMGVFLFLFNQKLSKFLTNRSITKNNPHEIKDKF